MAVDFHLRVVTPDRTVIDRKVASVEFPGIDGFSLTLLKGWPVLEGRR